MHLPQHVPGGLNSTVTAQLDQTPPGNQVEFYWLSTPQERC